jgi:hypothetical protein
VNVTKLTKFVVGSFATAGSAMLVNSVITEHARPKSMRQRISVVAARVVLTTLVVETTRRQSDKMVDETIKEWDELKKNWRELKRVLSGEKEPETVDPTSSASLREALFGEKASETPSPVSGTADN